MNELTLKELQSFGLDILDDVHHFCVSNNIKYSIAYGTLIGAIRHKGFIPWDDDVDIIMPRNDYDVFCRTYTSNKYKFSSIENDPFCRITFGRVYDDTETTIESLIPWRKGESGVWIDVFPVDAAENDKHEFDQRQKGLSKLIYLTQLERSSLRKYVAEKTTYRKVRLFFVKLFYLWGIFLPALIKKIIRKSKKINWDTTDYFGLLSYDSYGIKDYHSKKIFEECTLMPFENKEFMVLKGYDSYLRSIYGDYMKLPPIEQRKPKQSYIHFYWKKEYNYDRVVNRAK